MGIFASQISRNQLPRNEPFDFRGRGRGWLYEIWNSSRVCQIGANKKFGCTSRPPRDDCYFKKARHREIIYVASHLFLQFRLERNSLNAPVRRSSIFLVQSTEMVNSEQSGPREKWISSSCRSNSETSKKDASIPVALLINESLKHRSNDNHPLNTKSSTGVI